MHVDLGTLAVYVGLASIAVGGWNLYFHSKVREISALHKRLDDFSKDYQDDRLEMVEKYATKTGVRMGIEKLERHMELIEKKLDRLWDRGR